MLVILREPGAQHVLWYTDRHHRWTFVSLPAVRKVAPLLERNKPHEF